MASTGLLGFQFPRALDERHGLNVELRLVAIESLGFGAKPLLLGGGQGDGLFPLGRVALQLLQPDLGLALAVFDRALLLLHHGGFSFEANQVVLKLVSVAIQFGPFVGECARPTRLFGRPIDERVLPGHEPFRLGRLVGLEGGARPCPERPCRQ